MLCPKRVYYEIPITNWAFFRAILLANNALRGLEMSLVGLELLALMEFARDIIFSLSCNILGV
jgi:hypothetical protein